MANQLGSNKFNPGGGQEAKVIAPRGPQLGGTQPIGQSSFGQAQPVQQAQAQISAPNSPHGAQPVTLVGNQGPQLGSQPQQQAAPLGAAPGSRFSPMAALPTRPAGPALGAPQPQPQDSGDAVFTVALDPIDTVFPRGTKVMGYTIQVRGVGPDGKKFVAEYDKPLG